MNSGLIRIILADDNNLEHFLFAQILRELPHVSKRDARNGEELIAHLMDINEPLPDLIFLNIHMPVKNGIECLTEIRSNPQLAHLAVIIYSTSDETKHVDVTYGIGANMYLKKPLDFHELEESATWIINHYGLKGIPDLDRDHFVFSMYKHKALMADRI